MANNDKPLEGIVDELDSNSEDDRSKKDLNRSKKIKYGAIGATVLILSSYGAWKLYGAVNNIPNFQFPFFNY